MSSSFPPFSNGNASEGTEREYHDGDALGMGDEADDDNDGGCGGGGATVVVDSSAVLLGDDNDNHQQLTIAICSQSIIHVMVSSSTQFANAEMKKGTSVSRS